jgi:hypothetical protein
MRKRTVKIEEQGERLSGFLQVGKDLSHGTGSRAPESWRAWRLGGSLFIFDPQPHSLRSRDVMNPEAEAGDRIRATAGEQSPLRDAACRMEPGSARREERVVDPVAVEVADGQLPGGMQISRESPRARVTHLSTGRPLPE